MLGKLEDAKLIAGGQSLLPMMKLRLAAPANLVDLGKVEGLSGIELKGRAVVIGALATHAEVNASPVVKEALPALAELAGMIGDPAVRHRGTLGGSLAHNDPTADYPAACLALGATIITTQRRIPVEEFFAGLFETALAPDEIITKVSFPLAKKAAYQKFRNPASRYAIVGVFVASPSEVRVAVTGAGTSGVFRVPEFEQALKARFSPKVLEGLSVPADGLSSDLHASAEYRAHLIGVLARRAVAAAAKQESR
jgi:carbon-monoxide dehydrogenase medium subunit